jgi:ActR/RegA family two-component response regulator
MSRSHKAALQPELIDRVVSQLNALSRRVTLGFALAVGKIVIQNLYSGDSHASRKRHKDVSFRSLAARPDLAMGPSMLNRCVGVYELCNRLGITVDSRITLSHLELVLPLPEAEQARLVHMTEEHRWVVNRLDEEIGRLGIEPTGRRGRRRASRLRKIVRTFNKALAQARSLEAEGIGDEPSPDSAREAEALLRQLRDQCSVLETHLSRPQGGASEAMPEEPAAPSRLSEGREAPAKVGPLALSSSMPMESKELPGADPSLPAALEPLDPESGIVSARVRPKVLIVDDDQRLARTLGRVLARYGAEPILASGFDEAVALLANMEANALMAAIIDFRLRQFPDKNGLDLAAVVRSSFPASYITVLTGYLEEDAVNRAWTLDVPLIAKPLEPRQIRHLLERAYAKWSAPI